MFTAILLFIGEMIKYLFNTLYYDGIYLLLSIIIAVALAVYLDTEKLRSVFLRKSKFMILGSVGFGALTPLCACGTMAVVISLLTSALPWGPIMAFLVSSPLMSLDTFVLLSGFMGMQFALVLTLASIVLGLGAGLISYSIEKKTRFLDAQLRIAKPAGQVSMVQSSVKPAPYTFSPSVRYVPDNYSLPINTAVCCSAKGDRKMVMNCCSQEKPSVAEQFYSTLDSLKLKKFLITFWNLGVLKVIPLFSLFIMIAYLVKVLVPSQLIVSLFGGNHWYSIPLAALVGLPLYISDASVIPLLQVLKDAGASGGALLAFMIAGPATSLGVIGGLTVIMKRRAIILYVAFIQVGAIIMGYLYDLVLTIF